MKEISKNNVLKILFSLLIILFPLFSMYRFFNTLLSIGDVVSIFIILVLIIFDFKTKKINNMYIGLVMLVVVSTSIVFIRGNLNVDILGSALRFLMIYFLVSIHEGYFDRDFAKKGIVIISLISAIYLFIQYILARFNVFVGGGFTFLDYFREEVKWYVDLPSVNRDTYRPRSLFEEPAHFCQYVCVAISLLLFEGDLKDKKTLFVLGVLALGVIFSMSLIGWVLLFVEMVVFLLSKFKFKQLLKYGLIGMGLVLVLIVIFWNTNIVQEVLVAKFVNQNIFLDGRFAGYRNIKQLFSVDFVTFLFGNGMIGSKVYYTSILRIYYYFGIVGFIVFSFLAILLIKKYNHCSSNNNLIALNMVLLLGAEILFGKFILIYLCFFKRNKEVEEYNECDLLEV